MNSDSMAIATSPPVPDVSRRVLRFQVFTIIWMSVEPAISLGAAWKSWPGPPDK